MATMKPSRLIACWRHNPFVAYMLNLPAFAELCPYPCSTEAPINQGNAWERIRVGSSSPSAV